MVGGATQRPPGCASQARGASTPCPALCLLAPGNAPARRPAFTFFLALCSFLRLLQLFFSQSSGPQLCFSGLLRSLLVRYRWRSGRGGARPATRWPAAPAPSCPQLPAAQCGAGPRGRGAVGPGPGKGGPAARVELRMTSGLAPPSPHCCCLSDSRTPLATPQLGRHCPSLLVESFASGSGKQPGGHPRIEDGSRSGRPYWAGPGGRETGSRSAVTAWPSTARVRAPPQPLCVSPLSQTLSPAQQDSWVPR